jgi:hypothetical protein
MQFVRTIQGRLAVLPAGAQARAAVLRIVADGYEAGRARVRAERRAAQDKAMGLLRKFLTPQQAADLDKYQHFDVVSDRGRSWRILACGQSGNVQLLSPAGEPAAYFCAHPPGRLPNPAAWLAQAMTLITCEESFLAVANRVGMVDRVRNPGPDTVG